MFSFSENISICIPCESSARRFTGHGMSNHFYSKSTNKYLRISSTTRVLQKFCHWVQITSVLRFIKYIFITKKVREKSRVCHNHKLQPLPDPKRKRKPTNPNKHKSNKCTKSTKISSLFPKRGNRNTKRTEKHKNKMTHGNTYNKSPRRINHKATKSKTNIGTKLQFTKYQQSYAPMKIF